MHRRDVRHLAVGTLLLFAAVLTGCESDSTGSSEDEAADEPPAAAGDAIEVASVGDRFEYDRTEIEVGPDEEVKIVFTNTASDEPIKHNFVQLSTDKAHAAMKVAKAGWKAPDDEYVPDHKAVLAATPLAEPGESVDVSFTTPKKPGEYLYICTYPAHYPSMQGTLVVQEP